MLAVAVLMIGILVTINIFPAALKISKNAEQETVAANLAQAKIEEMFSLGYDNIIIGTIEAKHRLSADSANPFYDFQRQTVTTYVDGNLADSAAATGLKKISVTVYWIAPSLGIEKNSTFSVLISQR
jgi:hypothetical protein